MPIECKAGPDDRAYWRNRVHHECNTALSAAYVRNPELSKAAMHDLLEAKAKGQLGPLESLSGSNGQEKEIGRRINDLYYKRLELSEEGHQILAIQKARQGFLDALSLAATMREINQVWQECRGYVENCNRAAGSEASK